jgi:hypothetical protein
MRYSNHPYLRKLAIDHPIPASLGSEEVQGVCLIEVALLPGVDSDTLSTRLRTHLQPVFEQMEKEVEIYHRDNATREV